MANKFLLIDGNNLGYASQIGMPSLSNGDIPTQAILGYLTALSRVVQNHPSCRPVVLWDGKNNWRKVFDPNYKLNRSDTAQKARLKKEYHQQLPTIKKLTEYLGVDQAYCDNAEADDLAAIYTKFITRSDNGEVALITADQDWLQLIGPRVYWQDPIRHRLVDVLTFEDFTGFPSVEKFLDAKCLTGDNSDNLKGVGGIGKKGAKKLLEEWGSVEKFLAQAGSAHLPKAWGLLLTDPERQDRYWHNRKMMSLDVAHMPSLEKIDYLSKPFDRTAFLKECGELNFMSIVSQADVWLKPFAGENL